MSTRWPMMVMSYGLLQFLIVAQVLASWHDDMLTVSQMLSRGISQGMPLIWHFGIWSDAVVISPLSAWIVGRYAPRWGLRNIGVSCILSAAVTMTMGYIWALGDTSSAHIIGHVTTAAGIWHLIYMWLVLWILVLFLFATKRLTRQAIVIVNAILVVHVFFGTHLALGVIQKAYGLAWYPEQPLQQPLPWIVFAMVAGLVTARARVLISRATD